MIIDSRDFTLRGPGAELITESDANHARVLGNTNLTLEGACHDVWVLFACQAWPRVASYAHKHSRPTDPCLNRAGAPNDPLLLDSDPLGFAQGWVLAANQEEATIDLQLMDGYALTVKPNRIELFTSEGVMLPHVQDVPQEHTDLGEPPG